MIYMITKNSDEAVKSAFRPTCKSELSNTELVNKHQHNVLHSKLRKLYNKLTKI